MVGIKYGECDGSDLPGKVAQLYALKVSQLVQMAARVGFATFINAEDAPQLLLLPSGHIIVTIAVSESNGVSWSFSGGKEDAGEVFALQE